VATLKLQDVRRLHDRPLDFIRTALGVRLWEKQRDIVSSVWTRRRTAVRSCHGSGKTYTAATIAAAWLATVPYSLVLTTAPTGRQVKKLLWKELRTIKANARWNLGGRFPPAAPEWTMDEGWLAIGFSTDDPVNSQGWHSRGGTLIIMDEAPGIDADTWQALSGALTGENDRLLAIGNPVDSCGPFYEMFKKADVSKIVISAFDTPNVKLDRVVLPGLVTRQWIEDVRTDYGEDSPLWDSRVLGNFPTQSDRTLVPLAWVEAAQQRWHAMPEEGEKHLGVDVARKGKDSSVIAPRTGNKIGTLRKYTKRDTMELCGWVIEALKETEATLAKIDCDGIGAGVFDRLKEQDYPVVEVHTGIPPGDPMDAEEERTKKRSRFANKRAEILWYVRERLDPTKPDAIGLPPDDKLVGQLTSIPWRLNSKGQIRIDTKEEMAEKGMHSPDETDALALSLMPHTEFVFY
jgi:hypothetical protein